VGAKETYIGAKEAYVGAKETYIGAKEANKQVYCTPAKACGAVGWCVHLCA
jgi:hypothetical protein